MTEEKLAVIEAILFDERVFCDEEGKFDPLEVKLLAKRLYEAINVKDDRDEMLRAMWLYRTDNMSKPQFRKFLEDRGVPSDKIERMLVTYSWENAG